MLNTKKRVGGESQSAETHMRGSGVGSLNVLRHAEEGWGRVGEGVPVNCDSHKRFGATSAQDRQTVRLQSKSIASIRRGLGQKSQSTETQRRGLGEGRGGSPTQLTLT